MKKNNGFTLIELVIVIIVLGILAATAVPKFINLQDDAKESALKGLSGALNSAANIVYAKSAIDGNEKLEDQVVSKLSSGRIETNYGYPKASDAGIRKAVEVSGFSNSEFTHQSLTAKAVVFYLTDGEETGACTLVYQEATSSAGYQIWFGTDTKATSPDCS